MRTVFARSLACVFAVAAMAMGSAGAVHADRPEVIPIDISFVDDFNCSFPFNVQLKGEYKQVINNNRTINNYNFNYIFTNPANGKTITAVNRGPDLITVNPDGSTTIKGVGIFFRATLPGAGVVLLRAGTVVVQFPADPSQPPQVTFQAGPNGSPSDLCPYLAS